MSASTKQQTPASTSATQVQPTRSLHQRSYRDSLGDLERRFNKLTKDVLPHHPYYNDIPTDTPFDPRGRYTNDWAVGPKGLFSAPETHLQYMTFLPNITTDTLLVSIGGWADENGNIMEEDISRANSRVSGNSTPVDAPQRKKISLSDYKKKALEGSTTTRLEDAGNRIRDGAVQERASVEKKRPVTLDGTGELAHTRKDVAQVNGARRFQTDGANGVTGKKRRLEDDASPLPNKQVKPSTVSSSDRRPVQPPEPARSTTKDRSHQTSNLNGIPRLISPTLPPMVNEKPDLPRLLSPTLPPDIEEYLQQRSSVNGHRKTDSSSSIEDKRDQYSNSESSHSLFGVSNGSGIGLGISQGSSSVKAEVMSRSTSAGQAMSRTPSTATKASTEGTATRKSKIVKLKYGKRNRRRVTSLLKLSSKRTKRPSDETSPKPTLEQDRKDDVKGNIAVKDFEKERSHLSVSRAEKRPREAEDEGDRSLKRPKSSSNDRPQTPSTVTAGKSPFTTPKKELKGSAMRRVQSTEGAVKTPVGNSTSTPKAPSSVERSLASTKASPYSLDRPPTSQSREEERRAWKSEYGKYISMGRELKHAADRHKSLPDTNGTGTHKKLAAATAVEAIVAFMLAFLADDQAKAIIRQQHGDSDSWRSILAYWTVVKNNTEPYPHLYGLICLLGAVSRDVIHGKDLDRLAMSSLPSDNSPAPTPGSDGTTVTTDDAKKQRREFMELKARLPDMYREAQILWLEGARQLSDETLARDFPDTWAKRSRNFEERGRERLVPERYSNGGFFLPLGRTTTPLEAVRFAMTILAEWCEKENVPWKARLKL